MTNFTLAAALSALAGQASALCFGAACGFQAWLDVQAEFDNSLAGDYEWQMLTAREDDYKIRMVRFIGDAAGDDVADQWTRQPVLFYQDKNDYNGCFSWITQDTMAAQLFDLGYDVYIGCRRGNSISDGNPNNLDEETYWDFDIQDVGEMDVTAMLSKITQTRNNGSLACTKIAVVTADQSIQDVLAAAAAFPNDFDSFVSNVIGNAPCISSNLDQDCECSRRMLEEESSGPSEEYWTGVGALCGAFPEACFDYCDFFPYFCEEFCVRFPDFCRPAWVDAFDTAAADMKSLGYYAIFKDDEGGLTWGDKANAFCAINSDRFCYLFQAYVGSGRPVLSLKELEQEAQNSYKASFNEFSATWFEDGWQDDSITNVAIDLTAVPVAFQNLFVTESEDCNIEETKQIFDDVSLPGYFIQFNTPNKSDLNASDSGYNALFLSLLAANVGGDAPANCAAFGFND